MNLDDYPEQDGKKVWLSEDETQRLLETAEEGKPQLAMAIGVRCGLRTDEIVRVAPDDVADTDAGTMLRIWESAKTGEYRETPIPTDLASQIRAASEFGDAPGDEALIDVSTRTLRRWMDQTTATLREQTGDAGWQYVGMHDLRRTWATQLRSADVDAMVVLDWGGWSDLETFLDHYRGTHTPEAQRRERAKVDWL
ncbi:tyrosine-type recombinase/integrase [Halapricum desulfuricans]|uniref:Transcriptional regulator, contains HTH domain n=1 Tax=Halapricum desulfuricans TaxID=2841257 RepID=A0A897N882_9EURY|nr:tyrosine-type recombinase/integrase [Halapricum desulfuricans]QSG08907.1 Transcriptional regulator, contains HTH domain [Halapricum desulfuricans]